MSDTSSSSECVSVGPRPSPQIGQLGQEALKAIYSGYAHRSRSAELSESRLGLTYAVQ